MTRRELGLLLLGIFIGVAIRAGTAGETYFEAGFGAAKGHTAPDGIWWESQYPTENRVNGKTWQLGISHVFDSRFGLRADYTDLQRSSTNNVAIPNENAVNARLAGAVSCADGAQYCLAQWNGHGRVKGVHLGTFYDFRPSGFHVQPEVGAFVYRYQFSMELTPLEEGALCGDVSRESGAGAGTFLTGYARLTVIKDRLFARIDYNHNVKGHGGVVGIQEGPVTAVLIGVVLKL